ncbi:unnamed protein product [Mesocestoides corti]|uniref:Uncharacterized protein n=1 Tax=Mesocestoides corti TaxID=53468 RepID=A0A0R3UQF3_MESCO|nr:unnamed protein product [Mesocestoides corti]
MNLELQPFNEYQQQHQQQQQQAQQQEQQQAYRLHQKRPPNCTMGTTGMTESPCLKIRSTCRLSGITATMAVVLTKLA